MSARTLVLLAIFPMLTAAMVQDCAEGITAMWVLALILGWLTAVAGK